MPGKPGPFFQCFVDLPPLASSSPFLPGWSSSANLHARSPDSSLQDHSPPTTPNDRNNDQEDWIAPGVEILEVTQSTETGSLNTVNTKSSTSSQSKAHDPYKKMKAASKASQFYTTIVIKSCIHCREFHGFVGAHRRATIIFKTVERSLRDRVIFPLPDDVNLKDLMEFSYFKGTDADSSYQEYCLSDSTPLQESMNQFATRLYNNKFTDAKKMITNHVVPKFLKIIRTITGNGQKSGQAHPHPSTLAPPPFHFLLVFMFSNLFRYNEPARDSLGRANRILHEVSCVMCNVWLLTSHFSNCSMSMLRSQQPLPELLDLIQNNRSILSGSNFGTPTPSLSITCTTQSLPLNDTLKVAFLVHRNASKWQGICVSIKFGCCVSSIASLITFSGNQLLPTCHIRKGHVTLMMNLRLAPPSFL